MARVLGLLLLLGLPAQANDDTTIAQLEQLADWCAKAKLYRARQEVCEALLLLDSDHARARKLLRFRKGKGGSWQRSKFNPSRDLAPKRRPEFIERRLAIANGLWGRLAATAPVPHASLRLVVSLDPNHASARAALGEVKQGDRWLLRETVYTGRRRQELIQLARDCDRRTPAAKSVAIDPDERQLGVAWSSAYEVGEFRLVATTTRGEARSHCRLAESCRAYVGAVWLLPATPIPGRRFHVVANRAEYRTAIGRHPKLDDGGKRIAHDLQSWWISRTHDVIIWAPDDSARREWVARQSVNQYLSRLFGISAKVGWAWEGVGLLLTYRMTGRHTTWWVRRSGYAVETDPAKRNIWKLLTTPGTSWLAIARELAESKRTPELRVLVSRDTNSMTGPDLVWSYALASYLVEGMPATKTKDLLLRLGRGEHANEAFPAATGYDLPQLQQRLLRWLRETR